MTRVLYLVTYLILFAPLVHADSAWNQASSDLGDWLYLRVGRSSYGWMNTRWNYPYGAFGVAAAG